MLSILPTNTRSKPAHRFIFIGKFCVHDTQKEVCFLNNCFVRQTNRNGESYSAKVWSSIHIVRSHLLHSVIRDCRSRDHFALPQISRPMLEMQFINLRYSISSALDLVFVPSRVATKKKNTPSGRK